MTDESRSPKPDLSDIPLFNEFWNDHKLYERYHIHLVGLTGRSKLHSRKNRLGVTRVIDAVADPYVTVETIGSDTGSTTYFPIGKHTFPVLQDCKTPLWDAKCLLVGKKETTDGIQFKFMDKNKNRSDEELFSFTLSRSELPDITPINNSEWTKFTIEPENMKDVALEFHIMVTDGSDKVVNDNDVETMLTDYDGYEYTQEILPDNTDCDFDNAVLQCWMKNNGSANTKAIFWVLGRNDCFMHPHVAKSLFFDNGYDLFVLNYKMNGECRKHGFVKDPHYNSHNFRGSFDVYIHDIDSSLEKISTTNYETLVGYAHSTGGPVLLNYLMERGDDAFDAFVFNSPFLDWGFVGGDMVEFVLENTGILTKMSNMDNDSKVGVATTPEELRDTPIVYRGQEIVMSDWSARLWSVYDFDFESRPLYNVPITIGFCKGVTDVHRKLEERHSKRHAVTSKPFLCITSRGDDVLKAPETLSRADWIGPSRWEVELNDNGHDVFLSYDPSDTDMAIDMVRAWMKNRRLI